MQQPTQKFRSCLTEKKGLCFPKNLVIACTEIVVICYVIRTERPGTNGREF